MSDSTPPPAHLATAGPYPEVSSALDRALALVEYLRAHCPWDARQTARSLVPHLLEETHETVDAIHEGDPDTLRHELGDLLLNLAFQVVVAEDEGHFDRKGVVEALEEKMVRRHPELFGGGEAEPWEVMKRRERPGGSPLDGLARGMSPLLRAHRVQEKVAGVGFDWDRVDGAIEKLREEVDEVEEVLGEGDPERIEEEVGDLLFAAVNVVRLAGAHPVSALDRANRKFERRFRSLEAIADAEGVRLGEASLETLDQIWDRVKAREGRDEGGE